ncbi:cytochrome c oxidase subunit 4 isoform 1, mitochondrial [Microplitis demolitor]|uniref:cytochrome c oxidase subunit 4 isoform 1, mitochondrial n=1 Tax=Microplitis demolitor TaxID=69319 RepID=UPI00043FFE6B|nr:cytochrome c oxidase subunit 4 isoform 1, mitochondrial [Microplitis demolitor]XP_014298847.1 cytochrome c oxidase subunit 4 isoform 1, mitochondrial [Microplitis demolitor]
MAGKLLVSCLRLNSRVLPMRMMSSDVPYQPHYLTKIGKREIVGYGMNGEPHYMDLWDYPFPSIRFKEITPDLQVLKDKEKGDWKKLSLDEKKTLYRASFCQTFAELDAPDGYWKCIIGCVLIGISLALWIFMYIKFYVYSPLPESFSPESQAAQLKRLRQLDVNPIWGINKRTPEELAKKKKKEE